jgi:hypothetical protein
MAICPQSNAIKSNAHVIAVSVRDLLAGNFPTADSKGIID